MLFIIIALGGGASVKLEELPPAPKLSREKFQARNWKQLSEREVKKLTLVQKSKYMAVSEMPRTLGHNLMMMM